MCRKRKKRFASPPLLLVFLLQAAVAVAVDERVVFNIKEEQPVGSLVGRLPLQNHLAYWFLKPNPLFSLDTATGELRNIARVDREVLVGDRVEFLVRSVPSARHVIEVVVIVADINDNHPRFPATEVEVTFREGIAAGQHVVLATATDLDQGVNGQLAVYSIVEGDPDDRFNVTDRNARGQYH